MVERIITDEEIDEIRKLIRSRNTLKVYEILDSLQEINREEVSDV